MFEFGIYIPEDFETDITHYELWADGYQIGERTSVDKTIRHLMISAKDVEKFVVRVYDGETFVDDCKIDTQVYQGELKIITGYTISDNKSEQIIGSYTVSQTGNDTMVSINLNINLLYVILIILYFIFKTQLKVRLNLQIALKHFQLL
jgi:hypothetical protein